MGIQLAALTSLLRYLYFTCYPVRCGVDMQGVCLHHLKFQLWTEKVEQNKTIAFYSNSGLWIIRGFSLVFLFHRKFESFRCVRLLWSDNVSLHSLVDDPVGCKCFQLWHSDTVIRLVCVEAPEVVGYCFVTMINFMAETMLLSNRCHATGQHSVVLHWVISCNGNASLLHYTL